MEFQDPIVAGDTLIREGIQSANYETGVSGWRISRDGTAEFQDLTARGDLTATSVDVEVAGTSQHVIIDNSGSIPLDSAHVAFTDDNHERYSAPGTIKNSITGGTGSARGWLRMEPIEVHDGSNNSRPRPRLTLLSKSSAGTIGPIIAVNIVNDDGADDGLFSIDDGIGVLASNLRHQFVTTSTDVSFTGDGSWAEEDTNTRITMPYPASGIVTVSLGFRGSTDTNDAILAMDIEIRDDDTSGTVRVSPNADGRAEIRRDANNTFRGAWTETFSGLPTSGTMFARGMLLASTGANCDVLARTITVIPSP